MPPRYVLCDCTRICNVNMGHNRRGTKESKSNYVMLRLFLIPFARQRSTPFNLALKEHVGAGEWQKRAQIDTHVQVPPESGWCGWLPLAPIVHDGLVHFGPNEV